MVELFRVQGRIGAIQYWLVKQLRPRLGDWGEWIALNHLLKCRYDVIARNWRIKHGEVDLIAYDGDYLVFIEVKSRRGPTRLPPERNVDEEKQSQLEFLAYSFLGRHELTDIPVRFDLIAIETPDQRSYEIRHYRGFM
jgi:putative endonuclease